MRLILTLALLAFPIAEIWILINLFQQYGWWVLLYLVAVGLLG
ncbi:MAG: FxsA family protein, partial [Methylotenera sp.]|nr:FxsA family protein [Methylotenera sp.]